MRIFLVAELVGNKKGYHNPILLLGDRRARAGQVSNETTMIKPPFGTSLLSTKDDYDLKEHGTIASMHAEWKPMAAQCHDTPLLSHRSR